MYVPTALTWYSCAHWYVRTHLRCPLADHRVDQTLRWLCVSTYDRPKGRASAKTLRESAIRVRKTWDFMPARFFVAFQRHILPARSAVWPDDSSWSRKNSTATLEHPADDRRRHRLQIYARWPELSLNLRKFFFFCRHDKNLRIYRRHFCPLAYTHK